MRKQAPQQRVLRDGVRAALAQIDRVQPRHRHTILRVIAGAVRDLAPATPALLVETLPQVARAGAPALAYAVYGDMAGPLSYGQRATILSAIVLAVTPGDGDLFTALLAEIRAFPIRFAQPSLLAGLAWGAADTVQPALLDEALGIARSEPDLAEQAIALAYTLPYLPDGTRGRIAREAADRLAAWDLGLAQAEQLRAFIAPYLARS